MNPAAALLRRPAVIGVLLTAACSIEPRDIHILEPDGAADATGQGGTNVVRDASEEAKDARTGSGGAGGVGGREDASLDGNAGKDGSSGAGGSSGAAGGTGSGGTAGVTGSGGTAGTGASGGAGGAAGAAGVAGLGAGGAAGVAGAGGVAGLGGAGATGGSGGGAGTGTGGTTGGSAGSDAGTTGGAAGQGGKDAGDVRIIDASRVDAPTGSTVVLFEENFDTDLGTFTGLDGCKMLPEWKNNGKGEGHAEEPQYLGASSIIGPTITVPANVSNVQLQLQHQVETEEGHDGTQVLVSVNGAAPAIVTVFTAGGYTHGVILNGDTCDVGSAGQFPGWSGSVPYGESDANLSATPFNVGPGNTVSIRLRIVVDDSTAGGGWDIDRVRLIGTAQ